MATITLTVDFDKVEGVNFQELITNVHQLVLSLGRDLVRQVLEGMDERLMEARDKSRYRNKGIQETTIKTIMGEVAYSRRVYIDAAAVESVRCVHLLDDWMDVKKVGLVSDDMCRIASKAVCENTYRGAAKLISECTGLCISHQGVWNIVQQLGAGQANRIERHAELMDAGQAVGVIDTPILYEENDGIWLSLQGKSREEHGPSREMKVGIAYDGVLWAVGKGGKKRRTLHNKVAYAAFEPAAEFKQHKEALVRSRFDTDSVQLRVLNGDGAKWIHNNLESDTISVLDKYHRNKKITECVRDEQFANNLRALLYSGETDTLLDCIEGQINALSVDGTQQELDNLNVLYTYFSENKDALLDPYQRGIEIPETSQPGVIHHARLGSMESNVFTLIGNRMKGRRRCWSVKGANNLAALLCMYHTSGFESLFDVVAPPVIKEEKPIAYRYSYIPTKEGKGYEFWANSSLTHASRWFKEFAKSLRYDDVGF